MDDMNVLPPAVAMLEMAAGLQVSQALYAVAELDIASLLVERPQTVDDLAEATEANPHALGRVVRFLESLGVFRVTNGVVQATALGEVLAEDVPGSARGVIRHWMATRYAPYGDIMDTMRAGEPDTTHYFGDPFFDWVAEAPRQ